MGGALTFAGAVSCPEFSAGVPFYGIPRSDRYDLTKIKIPVQGHFGEKDEITGLSSPSDYNPLYERLTKAGVPYEMFTYPAGHGFINPTGPHYDETAAQLALSRLYEFMQKHLQ